jgi:hypothetical protein
MADYKIRFVGHISEAVRPEGFPREIYYDLLFREQDDGITVRDITNQQMAYWVKIQGMTVLKDHTPKLSNDIDVTMFVPMSMISFIDTQTSRLAAPIPNKKDPNVKLN